MATISSIPSFTIRWAEPLSMLRTRQQALEVDVHGESTGEPIGRVSALTHDDLGPLPAGSARGDTKILHGTDAMTAVDALWKQVRRDRFEQWVPQTKGTSDRLGRNEIELVVDRGNTSEAFRTSLRDAPAPVQDLLAAAARLHADVRLHPGS